MNNGVTEIIAVSAAVASALAALFSALAARKSQRSADAAERRASIRQAVLTAREVIVEARRVEARGNEAKLAYQSLAVFSGASGGSRESLYINAIKEKMTNAGKQLEYAKRYSEGAGALQSSSLADIEAIHTDLLSALSEVRSLREDLEREHATVEGQCSAYRENAIRGKSN